MTADISPKFKKLPEHVAIIMDGNGRWAKAQGKERVFGHHKGVETVRTIVELSVKTGIKYLSLFAFSTENWNRPQEEVNAIMELLIMAIERELPDLHKNNIRLLTIGDIEKLPQHCKDSIRKSIETTSGNSGMTLCIALSYSGKWDLTQSFRQIAEQIKLGSIKIEEINEELISSFLSTSFIPDPDLLIRTGGESRISNFFLWQCAYSELYFTNKFWPEFDEPEYYNALRFFEAKERRFGKISEQLK